MSSIFSRVSLLISGKSASTATIQTFVVKVFIIALNLGTGVTTARVLGSDGRGELAAILLWPQFLAFGLTFGVPSALIFNFKRYPEEKDELFSLSLVFAAASGTLATAIGIVFMPTWLSQYPPETIRAAQWFMLFAPLSLFGVSFTAAFEAREEFTLANQLRYLTPATTLLSILLLLVFGVNSPVAFGLAYALPNIPINLWMFIRLQKHYKLGINKFRSTSQKLLGYGVKAYGVDLLGILSGKAGEALVVSFLTPTAVGLYIVAMSVSRMLNVFEDAISTVLIPRASARSVNEIVEMTGRAVRISTFLTVLCVIPLMFLGPFLIPLVYGGEFIGAIPVFRILLIEVLLSGSTWMLGKAFMASGKPGIVTVLQGSVLVVSIPSMLFLIPRYGLIGAGSSLLLATAMRFLLTLICYPVVLKLSPPSLVLKKSDIRYMKLSLMNQRNKL